MSRCREDAGVLFKRACKETADATCARCHKPVCLRHRREIDDEDVCVTCLRQELDTRSDRGSVAWLRDDPYFYWYHSSYHWHSSPYTSSDYALFDDASQPQEADLEAGWEGS